MLSLASLIIHNCSHAIISDQPYSYTNWWINGAPPLATIPPYPYPHCPFGMNFFIFNASIQRMGEGTVFTLSVHAGEEGYIPSSQERWVPTSQPIGGGGTYLPADSRYLPSCQWGVTTQGRYHPYPWTGMLKCYTW